MTVDTQRPRCLGRVRSTTSNLVGTEALKFAVSGLGKLAGPQAILEGLDRRPHFGTDGQGRG
jgi:hypothetical protein